MLITTSISCWKSLSSKSRTYKDKDEDNAKTKGKGLSKNTHIPTHGISTIDATPPHPPRRTYQHADGEGRALADGLDGELEERQHHLQQLLVRGLRLRPEPRQQVLGDVQRRYQQRLVPS